MYLTLKYRSRHKMLKSIVYSISNHETSSHTMHPHSTFTRIPITFLHYDFSIHITQDSTFHISGLGPLQAALAASARGSHKHTDHH